MKQFRVGYVLKMFPRLSETFVLNEILELERRGAEVSTFSLMYPNDGRFHAGVARLRHAVRYEPSQKHEATWEQIRSDPGPIRFENWSTVAEFAERYRFPRPLEFVLRAQVIAQQVVASNIDHLHAHFATVSTRMAAAVSMLSGVPFSFTAHAKDIFRENVDRKLFSELVDRSRFCVTVSDYNKKFIEETMPGVDGSKVVRLYNGVDLRALELLGRVAPERAHLVSVGRLVPKKGFDVLLRAVAQCKSRRPDLRVTIVGDGEQRGSLERLRSELGLDDAVAFSGALPHERTMETLARANVVGLACRSDEDGNTDALPTVLLEALALGLPIVSTRIAGVPEIVGDGGGAVCEPDDVDGLARGIGDTLAAVESGTFDAAGARRRCEELFSLETNAGMLLERFTEGQGVGSR
jgi:glycosyltransferase involved in cell wall biosynthesis